METIIYKNYRIEQHPYDKYLVIYTPEDYDGLEDKRCGTASSIDEAKDEISEMVFLETYPERWAVEHSKSLAPVQWDFLSDAMKFTVQWDAMPLFKFNSI
jgi:hypothetical protein